MDQKHAMLYPEFESTADQRVLASTALGLPTDPTDQLSTNAHNEQEKQQQQQHEPPPPSYDAAVRVTNTPDSTINDNWYRNSFRPTQQQQQQFSRSDGNTRSFIAAEPNAMPAVNVITQQHFPKLGPHPCTVFCPSCGTARMTRMAYTPNTRTHFCALLLCLVGWCCCACFVPYCTNSCRTGNHYCAVCNTFLGAYNAQENN